MKKTSIQLAASAAIAAALLAACGGGDDDLSGGQTEFSIVPTETTVTGPAPDVCPGGGTIQRVQIIGGAPPYIIFNTSPQAVSVSTDKVTDQGGFFEVTWLGGCFDKQAVTVRDTFNRTVIFSASAEEGQ